MAAFSDSSPFDSEFALHRLLVLFADFTNNWFVSLVGVVASSSARAALEMLKLVHFIVSI